MIAEPRVQVTVRRRFAAPPERVFAAWLDPATVGAWLFATPTGRTVRCEIDAGVGDRYVIVDRCDGEDVAHTGEYLEIDPPRRLAFTLSVPTYGQEADCIIVEILPLAEGCELTLPHELGPVLGPETGRLVEAGWTGVLAGLAATIGEGEAAAPSEPDAPTA